MDTRLYKIELTDESKENITKNATQRSWPEASLDDAECINPYDEEKDKLAYDLYNDSFIKAANDGKSKSEIIMMIIDWIDEDIRYRNYRTSTYNKLVYFKKFLAEMAADNSMSMDNEEPF